MSECQICEIWWIASLSRSYMYYGDRRDFLKIMGISPQKTNQLG